MKDPHSADDLGLFANTPTEAESQLHSLPKTTRRICVYVNSNKSEYKK